MSQILINVHKVIHKVTRNSLRILYIFNCVFYDIINFYLYTLNNKEVQFHWYCWKISKFLCSIFFCSNVWQIKTFVVALALPAPLAPTPLTAIVTQMHFVGSNSRMYYNNLHNINRLTAHILRRALIFQEGIPWSLKNPQTMTWFYLAAHVSVTSKKSCERLGSRQELLTSGKLTQKSELSLYG